MTGVRKLGPYEIQSRLGAGGMGEVYRASDPRLAREVAIKLLPEVFSAEPDRLRRFEQEARAVAALNHPNILSVHDFGQQDGVHFLVTELLDGCTLREKLRSGPLGARRAVDYSIQLVQGLAAAHEKGLIHRDIKPENIFITKDGRVKILDFGLTKQSDRQQECKDDEPTLAETEFTSAGVVLGTVGYMSPEQVQGKAVDARTDIFAFGSVLYEMLTGLRAFKRGSSVETMAAILKEEPLDISSSSAQIPVELQRVVNHCLEKDPKQRFQSAKDLSFALENIGTGYSSTQTQANGGRVGFWKHWRLGSVVLILALLAFALAFLRPLRIDNRVSPDFKQITFRNGFVGTARFAHDGRTIVYTAAFDRPAGKLFSSSEDGTEVRDLDLIGTVESVSHSGELAVILASGTLARVPLSGGAPRELLEDVVAADWSPDGTKLAVARLAPGKCLVEYPIGNSLYESVGTITSLRIAPEGDVIAFMEHPLNDDRGTVVLVDLKRNKRTLTREWTGEQGLAWSPNGRELMFTATKGTENERDLYSVSRSGKLRLVYRAPGGVWLEDIASDGRVLLKHQERRFEVTLGKIGGASRALSSLQIMVLGSVSRDGQYAVMTDMSGNGGTDYRVYFAKLDGSPAVLLGSGVAGGISPDNKWVAAILPSDPSKVLLMPTGAGEAKTVTASGFVYSRALWSQDGHSLVVHASQSSRPLRFWIQDIDGSSPRPLTPEGVDSGPFLTVHHVDYVAGRDPSGSLRLYPMDGGTPRSVVGIAKTDTLAGGSPESDEVYVSPDREAIPQEILKVNIATGIRGHLISISPTDPAGILQLGLPTILADQKTYVGTQMRSVSTLYVATGLK